MASIASNLPTTMKAVQTPKPGPPSVLEVNTIPVPKPKDGQVLIKVKAVGLNRSEIFTRQGHSPGVKFPRVQGIEAAGLVASCPGGEFTPGDVVMTCMGEMGRAYDGGYAEYTCVPAKQVRKVEVESESGTSYKADADADPVPVVGWHTLGAIPEMMQTAWGSLVKSLFLKSGERLLIRAGTSSVGLAAAALAKGMGAHVSSTSRRDTPQTTELLKRYGVDEVVLDDGNISARVDSGDLPKFDKCLELIGVTTLRDSLRCMNAGGMVCNTGILGNSWQLKEEDQNPMDLIPSGVMLTVYTGGVAQMLEMPVEDWLARITGHATKDGESEAVVPIGKVVKDGLEGIREAHELMEANKVGGKIVVLV